MQKPPKTYHYLYRTTCLVTGKFYVGMHSTDDLNDGYLGSGKILGRSRKKHGDEKHVKEILEHCASREALKLREKEIVSAEMLANPLNINLKIGGEGGWDHIPQEVVLSNLSKRNVGWATYNRSEKGRLKASENIRKINVVGRKSSYGFRGKQHTDETKQIQSQHHQGAGNSQYGTCWVTKDNKSSKIKKTDLDEYLANGFSKGRVISKMVM
jgi:hypothetical protein